MTNNNSLELLEKYFDTAIASPDGIQRLRELILSLAMQGKLVPQDSNDTPAKELLKEIEAEKERLIKEGKIKRSKKLPDIKLDEIPYSLPEGWEFCRFKTITKVLTCGIASTPKYYSSGRIFLSAKNIKPYRFMPGNHKFIDEETYQKIISNAKPERGDILMTRVGAGIGEAAIIDSDIEFAYYVSLTLIKPFQEFLDSSYILHFLNSNYGIKNAISNTTGLGASQGNLNVNSVRLYVIPIPPLNEQHRIVKKIDFLMSQCDKLEKLRAERDKKRLIVHSAARDRLLNPKDDQSSKEAWDFIRNNFSDLYSVKENVKELRKSILQLAVIGKLVPQDLNDPPASELLKEIEAEKEKLVKEQGLKTSAQKYINRDEIYIETPACWEYCRLGNLAKFIDYRGKTPVKVDSGIPLITAKNIRFGFINREPYEYITEEEYKKWMTRGFPKIGDVLFTTEAPLGNIAIIDIQERFALAQRVICLQLHKPNIAIFLKLLMMSNIFQDQLLNNATGMTAKGIKASRLKEIPIPLPPLPEQHRIVAKVDQLMALCDQLEQQIDQSTNKQTDLLNAVIAKI